jgi:hypothetical protein
MKPPIGEFNDKINIYFKTWIKLDGYERLLCEDPYSFLRASSVYLNLIVSPCEKEKKLNSYMSLFSAPN